MDNIKASRQIPYPPILNFSLYAGSMLGVVMLWHSTWWPLVFLCWLPMAHIGHSMLIALHEAVHFNLSPKRLANEIRGFNIGMVSLIPLSAYRVLHGYHHSSLASLRDMELWPYTDTRFPRWARVTVAWLELFFGYIATPIIFLHGVLCVPNMTPAIKRRIILEYAASLLFWATTLTIIHLQGWWMEFLVAYLVPAMLSGMVQTMRKFTEHMGLLGDGPLTSTRSVIHEDLPGEILSASMLHVNHHGTHHRFGKVPYHQLPTETSRA